MTRPSPQLRDADLEALLQRRASHAALSVVDRERIVASAMRSSAQRRARWAWHRSLLPLTAVVTVLLIVGVAVLGNGPFGPSSSPPTASGAPSTANPASDVQVLDLAQLQEAIDASRGDGIERVVIAGATVDRSDQRLGAFGTPICVTAPCGSIGILEGIVPLQVASIPAEVDASLPMPPVPTSGALALDIHGHQTIELLGVVELNKGGSIVWPANETGLGGALHLDSAHTIAITGWLASTNTHVVYDCYIRPGSPPPTDSPFEGCGASAWIASASTTGMTSVPFNSIKVQSGAYGAFAPDPMIEPDGTVQPRLATYLLRVIVDPNCGPTPCRGWRVIGRVTDGAAVVPTASPTAVGGFHIDSTDELPAAIAAARVDGLDHVVIAHASIDRASLLNSPRALCRPQDLCPVGLLSGVDVPGTFVLAGPEVSAGLSGRPPPDPITGILALEIHGRTSIELMGVVDSEPSGGLLWPATARDVYTGTGRQLGHVIAVDGWLGASRISCPSSTPGVPGDSPFQECAGDWLVSSEMSSGGPAPSNAIRVQPGAFSEFAPLPGRDAPTAVTLRGTYLLRLVADPRTSCGADCGGWRMVGRLGDASMPSTIPSPQAISPFGPLSTQALIDLVTKAWIGRTVVAEASIGGLPPSLPIGDCMLCPIGTVENLLVFAQPEGTRRFLANRDARVFAFRIHPSSLEMLGPVDPAASFYTWAIENAKATVDAAPRGTMLVVQGWLVGSVDDGRPRSCPVELPRPSAPPDTPFGPEGTCHDASWITAIAGQPDPSTDSPAEPFIRVQDDAYAQYAVAPERMVDGHDVPAPGTFLLESVAWPTDLCPSGICRGWRIAARLDPLDQPPSYERAAAAVPDSTLDPASTDRGLTLIRDYLIDVYGGRPLAAATVDTGTKPATVTFHAFDSGETIVVQTAVFEGSAVILSYKTSDEAPTLSAWEVAEARRIAIDGTGLSGQILKPGDPRGVECPRVPGFCALVPIADESFNPPVATEEVIVDLGRNTLVDVVGRR